MTWELHLRHYGRDGSLKNGYIQPLTARYTNSLDKGDPLVFSLNALTYAELASVVEFDLFEVMIRNLSLGIKASDGGFVRDFVGVVRGSAPDRNTGEDGQTYLSWYVPEQKHIFTWRRVAYPAGTANRSKFTDTPAETAVKTLINTNCTTLATTGNDRWRNGDLAAGMGVALDVEADGGAGENVSLSFTGGILLDGLTKICELGGDYYQIEWQGGAVGGDHEFAITWGRGSDKSSGANQVVFSIENGTMQNPRRRYRYSTGTVAIAAGQGPEADRAVTIVNGDDYAADNDIEVFVDARNSPDEDGRTGQGESGLNQTKEESELVFDVIQTGDIFYSPVAVNGRKTYHIGDRVLADYGSEEIRRIRSAAVNWESEGALLNVSVDTELWT